MFRMLLRLGLLLAAAIIAYNYFLGNPDEKASSKAILSDLKKVTTNVVDVIKDKKEDFDDGKYDAALDNLGNIYDKLSGEASEKGDGFNDELNNLQERREQLETELEEAESQETLDDERVKSLKDDLLDLVKDTNHLLESL